MRNILVTCAGVIAGIFSSSVFVSPEIIFLWIFLVVACAIVGKIFRKRKVILYAFALFFIGMICGVFRTRLFEQHVSYDLRAWEGESIAFTGMIVSSPIGNGSTQKFTVKVFTIKDNNKDKEIEGNVLMSVGLFPQYHYGDMVQVRGKIKKPEVINDGTSGSVFNYPRYLTKSGVTETMSFGSVKSIGENKGNIVKKSLYGIRDAFVKAITRILPEPQAGLLSGIVLGTQTLAPALTNNFRIAGLSHIVVLSGYNITIVAESLLSIALYFTPGGAAFIALGGVALFVVMAGAGASAVRAGVMASIALVGKRFGKTYDAGRALFFASFLMVLWNPYTLMYDPSFHLSFLATFGMIYVSPLVLERMEFVTERFGFREILGTTLAVTFFVLPYILFMSGSLSIYSIPANIVILPFVPLTMAVGLVTAVFGFLPIPLRFIGFLPGIVSYAITRYDIFLADTISRLPYAQIGISNFSLIPLVLSYMSFGFLYYFKIRKRE